MKVLWFTNNPSCYVQSKDYNGGGWISSLEKMIKKCPEIDLGVAFYYNDLKQCAAKKVDKDGVTYYLIQRPYQTFYYRVKQFLTSKKIASLEHERIAMPKLVEVVKDFNPDIIHVFGSENVYGLLANYTNVPVVLHVQGFLSAILNSFLPPTISWNDYLFSSVKFKSLLWKLREKYSFERNSYTEWRIIKSVKYYMGRTLWDKSIIGLINPNSHYFNCGEILRDAFYTKNIKRKRGLKPIYVSVLSWQIYKGYDLILKTAHLLREFVDFDFEWHIYGNLNPNFIEKQTGLYSKNTSIIFKGVATSEELRSVFSSAIALIHPSYIENSSNIICEAQMSGCPCIATNVGGTCSIIEHGKTGILVPSNDPYMLAYNMKCLYENDNLRLSLSENAYNIAKDRHDKDKIVTRVLDIYKMIQQFEKE